jgi:hypothetical protein
MNRFPCLQLNANCHPEIFLLLQCGRSTSLCDLLTSVIALITFDAMFASGVRIRLQLRRVVSAATLLFVFFLPLHFHFSFTAQVTKECSCIHGTRMQLAPHADTPAVAPTLQITVLVTQFVFSWAGDWSTLQSVRGPPSTLSV